MHYFTFNIGDYHSHSGHLSEMEDLAYRRMLDWIYLHESPLPDSVDQIARLIRMRTHSESIANVLHEFFVLTEYGYTQDRCMREIDRYKNKSSNAKQAAEARWGAKPNKSNANALQTDSERNANHKPITNNQEPLTKNHSKSSTRRKAPRPEYKKFQEFYNNLADNNGLPRAVTMNDKRKRLIDKAVKYSKSVDDKHNTESLDYWHRYFEHLKNREHFMADTQRGKGYENWKPDFDYCIRESTWAQVVEGKL